VVFLINANLGARIAAVVEQYGRVALLVTQLFPSATPDDVLVAAAQAQGWIILTSVPMLPAVDAQTFDSTR